VNGWEQNVGTVQSVITDIKWTYCVKVSELIFETIGVVQPWYTILTHILYLTYICFAAQNIITQDSIAIRHYWWCKLCCYSSLWPFFSYVVLIPHSLLWVLSVYRWFINVYGVSMPRNAKPRMKISIRLNWQWEFRSTSGKVALPKTACSLWHFCTFAGQSTFIAKLLHTSYVGRSKWWPLFTPFIALQGLWCGFW